MLRNVIDGLAEHLQHPGRSGVGRIERAKQISQFRKGDSGMIDDPRLQELIDPIGVLPWTTST